MFFGKYYFYWSVMNKLFFSLKILFLLLLIQGCSGNSFELRKNVELAPQYSKIKLEGETTASEFSAIFSDALLEAGGEIVKDSAQAQSTVVFDRFEEGRRIIAYTSERTVREYLVYLKIEYSIRPKNVEKKNGEELPKRRINIDRSYLYDADFALGKAEEEKRVKKTLYEEAARLILLRLKYSKD